ncbi:DUF4253 domain-containing protein [Streptomyces sp. ZYX-F-203]
MTTLADLLNRLETALAGRAEAGALPPGRLIDHTYQGTWPEPLAWLADTVADGKEGAARGWARSMGLRPVLMDTEGRGGGLEDWDLMSGEVSYPEDMDPEEFLAHSWRRIREEGPEGQTSAVRRAGAAGRDGLFAPFGPRWPGLAPSARAVADPEAHAVRVAGALVRGDAALREPRLALVPADRAADVPFAIGWAGALDHEDDAGVLSAVLRSWEERFAARLVALSANRMILSVAAPPDTRETAEAVAAEHLAFCPDVITRAGDLRTHAETGVSGRPTWEFRWE